MVPTDIYSSSLVRMRKESDNFLSSCHLVFHTPSPYDTISSFDKFYRSAILSVIIWIRLLRKTGASSNTTFVVIPFGFIR